MATPALELPSDLLSLTSLATEAGRVEPLLQRALEALGALVPYELAAVLRLRGDELRVVAAAGPLASAKLRSHAIELSRFPTVRRALELRQPVALAEHHHASEEGDPYDGVLDLPHGHACMVVPLFAAGQNLGIITLDARACGMYAVEQVRMAGVYGQIVSLALAMAEQAERLERLQLQLREEHRLVVEEAGGAEVACERLSRSRSPAVRELADLARQVASTALPVLILGETGTGKEGVAQALHTWSPRREAPFVKLNCSAIPEHLVESELFGHVRGAFTGADRDRRGRFLTANGGTLLLDEIGDMPLSAQARLLRVLQEGTFEPVGSDRTVRVDVRVIAATHVDLLRAVREGRFREDLYYRLAVIPLRLPALRERPEDALAIAEARLAAEARPGWRGPWVLPPPTREAIAHASWPGNIRELLNALERAMILCPSGPLEPAHLGLVATPAAAAPVGGGEPLPSFVENERRYFEAVLERTGGRLYGKDGAAAVARLKPTTLRSRLLKLGLRGAPA